MKPPSKDYAAITQVNWAKLAAFLDGEGCIGIAMTGRLRYTPVPVVIVTNTDVRLMAWLQDNFGGNVRVNHHRAGNRRVAYKWEPRYWDVLAILRGVREHLILKNEQAEIGIRLKEMVIGKWHRGERITAEIRREREDLADRIHVLNFRGVAGGKAA